MIGNYTQIAFKILLHSIIYLLRLFSRDMSEYNTFRRVASNLKDDCQFHAGFGDVVAQMHPPGNIIKKNSTKTFIIHMSYLFLIDQDMLRVRLINFLVSL